MTRSACGIAIAAALIGFGAGPARAGTYNVLACADAPGAANHSWTVSNGAPTKLESADDCGGTDNNAGLYGRDVLNVSNAPAGANTEWLFVAGPGTSITGVSYSRWLYKEDDDDWQPVFRADAAVLDTCAIAYPSISCTVGVQGGLRVSRSFPTGVSSLSVGLACGATGSTTCINGALGHHKANAVLYGATVTLSDPSAPTVSNLSGPLFAGGYLTGSKTATFDATDNTGIRTGRLYVDGSVRASTTYTCDFTYTVPCTNKSSASLSIDTRTLSDGAHSVQVAAVDPAGNETKSGTRSIVVDNHAPTAPVQLAVDGGQDWRPDNSFSATWTNPIDSGSPVAVAHYELCATNGSGCQPAHQLAGANVSRIDGLSVPAQGEWLLRVWLEDAAGNVDSANVATTTLRYGTPPAAPTPPTNSPQPDPSPAPTASDAPVPTDSTTGTAPLIDVTTTLTNSPSSQTPVLRRDPRLRLTTARVSGSRVVVRGRIASGTPARVVFTVRLRSGRLIRRAVRIRTRRFAISLRLRDPRGPLTARFAGDTTFRPASASHRISR